MTHGVRVVRRLRAIAVVDVVGYSRLMENDELGTHARVNDVFAGLVAPEIAIAGGRIVDRAGDGLLVEFESCTEAVKCAMNVQRLMARRNANDVPSARIELRVGVNVGDIIIDGDRIVGDGVNIAARLQTLSPPGGVCISGAVQEQLHEDLGVSVDDIGEVQLKNIARPIRAYILGLGKGHAVARRSRMWRPNLRSAWSRRALLAVLVGAGLIATVITVTRSPGPASSKSAPAMSVAIIPFGAKDEGTDQGVADGITDEVTRGLAATPWMLVTAPNVAKQSAKDGQDVVGIGRQLNVRYLVYGRVERRDGKLGVDAQLVDAGKGVATWTARVDSDDNRGIESGLSLRLNVLLREAVYDAETRRLVDSREPPRTAMEYKMLGDLATDTRFVSLASDRAARVQYEKALALDPNFVPALISVGYSLLTELDLNPDVDHDKVVDQIGDLSKRAVANDSASAPGWQFRAEALARQWRWDAALDASEKAIALDPGRAFAFGHRASLMILLGRPKDTLELVDKALGLTEQRFGFALLQRCRAYMALGDYRSAVAACQTSISREDKWMQHAYLVAAYAMLREGDNVESEKAALFRLYPNVTLARIAAIRYSNVPAYLEQTEDHFYRGLRQAGIAAK